MATLTTCDKCSRALSLEERAYTSLRVDHGYIVDRYDLCGRCLKSISKIIRDWVND